MNKAISSLALLKASFERRKTDYLDNFIPFVATLIGRYKYDVIEPQTVCNDFKKEFGLEIPLLPMVAIIKRASKNGLIARNSTNQLVPVIGKIQKIDFTKQAAEGMRQQEKVIAEFVKFAKAKYRVDLTQEAAENVFINFLKEHDIEILFMSQNSCSTLPKVRASKKEKFLLYNFILQTYKSEPELFKFIVSISVGHILANTLLCGEFDKFKGKLKGLDLYLDTDFILKLRGVGGDEIKDAYFDFLKLLIEEHVNLYIFTHTYEEIEHILQDALGWIEDPKCDPSLGSPALRYFIQNDYTASDIERFIVTQKDFLKKHKITVVDPPSPNDLKIYEIDVKTLYKIIVGTYKESNPYFNETEKDSILWRDIKSIEAIYLLRGGRKASNIKEAHSIFITTNSGLACASKRFEYSNEKGFKIPACLTDVYLGTLIWLQLPQKAVIINEKKIIADCYSALQPDDLLIKKYLAEIEKLRKEEDINDEEYRCLRSHRVAMSLLEEKTMGDVDMVSYKTVEEIYQEMTEKMRAEERAKLIEEQKKHGETRGTLLSEVEDKGIIKGNIAMFAGAISTIVGFVFKLLSIILLVLTVILPLNLSMGLWQKIVMVCITLVITLITAYYGYDFKGAGQALEDRIEQAIIKAFVSKK